MPDQDGSHSAQVGDPQLRSAIVEALGDGYFRTDARGSILEVNEAFCSLVGYAPEDVVGLSPPHPWWPADPEGLARSQDRLANLQNGSDVRVEFDEVLTVRDGTERTVLATVAVLRASDGSIGGFVGTVRDISGLAATADRAERLARLTDLLAVPVEEGEVLDAIIDGVITAVEPRGAGLLMPVGDGSAIAPRRHRGMGWSLDEDPLPVDANLPLTRAFVEGEAFFFEDRDEMVDAFPDVGPLLNRRDTHARATLPLRGRHGTTAVLHVLFPSDRSFDQDDRNFLRSVADRCGLALERAGIHEEQRREVDRARRLQRALGALGAASSPTAVADIVLREAVPALGGRAGSVSLLDPDVPGLRLLAHAGFDERSMQGWDTLALDLDLPGTDAVRERRAIYLGDPDEIEERYPAQLEMSRRVGDQAWAALPLMAGTEPLGLLFVNFREAQAFDAPQRLALETMADRAASAIERARTYAHEHDVAVTLQHNLLPTDLVERPSVRIATRYEAGAEGLDVGGDWFDAVGLPGGRIGLAVGDVVGRGLAAAATMGHLRSAMRALALQGDGPAQVLEGLDRFARSATNSNMATVAYAELHTTTGALDYAVAGHPPPVLVPRAGPPRMLEGARSPLLDVLERTEPRPVESIRMLPGDTLVLYTDGLTERRHETVEAGLHRLVATLAGANGCSPDELCELLLERVAGPGWRQDDVAILCARFQPVHDLGTAPARPEALGRLRENVERWLSEIGIPPADRSDLVVAVNEAAANAVEHAYRDGRIGEVAIEGDLDDDITIRVIDHGSWKYGQGDPERGRGMHIMRSLVDEVEIVRRTDGGTTVVLRRRVPTPGGAR